MQHTVIFYFYGIENTLYGIYNNRRRTKQKNYGCYYTTQHGISGIAVGILFIRLSFAFFPVRVLRGATTVLPARWRSACSSSSGTGWLPVMEH